MAKLSNLELRIKKLVEIDLEVALQNLLIDNEGVIIELLQRQLESGISGSGDPIMLYTEKEYAPSTIAFKKRYGIGRGRITDRITLYMRGYFYEGMYTTIRGREFNVKSTVPYFDKIVERSGPDVMKLTQENFRILMEEFIEPEIRNVIVEALNV